MLIWYSLLVPIIAVVFLYLFYKRQVAWWEYVIPIAVTAIFIVAVKAAGEYSMTKDTEYWGGWVQNATYYEAWNERVSCGHPIYRTETYTYPCGKNDTCTGSRTVLAGYEHSYDVDEHPEEYDLLESNSIKIPINRQQWLDIQSKFKNKEFLELNRAYHTKDGDAYVTSWAGDYSNIISVTTEHNYENRIINSDSVFNYKPVEGKDSKGLYEYVYNGPLDTPSVLPETYPDSEEISKLNAILGAKKEVRVWVLIYTDAQREIAKRQEALWKNGNMNELVICVGLDKDRNVQWAEVFSWSKSYQLKSNIRAFIENEKKLDLKILTPYLQEQIENGWTRRDFSEFNYLQVQQPTWAIVTAFLLSIIISGICSLVAVNNEFTLNDPYLY